MLEPRTGCYLLSVLILHLSFAYGQISDEIGNFAEVKSLLNEIRTVSLIKRGQLFDYNPNVTKDLIKQANFNDGTEASINRNYIDDLFENDILLTVDQARGILQEVKDAPRESLKQRSKRQAQPGKKYFWKSTSIPFKFYWNDADWQDLIHRAHRHIESETCIRFVENGTGPDYLLYTRGSGCWSNVGRVGGRQQISIGYGCDALGIVAHETFHALALWHEQSRTDRDEYIQVAWKKIFRGTESNFEKRSPKTSDNLNQPYDMGSVMHYGSKAFSSDWESYSILTNDVNYQKTIGQRATVSFKDAKMINLRYCSDVCPKTLNCKNGGYTDPNNCKRCKCPDGLGGNFCQSVPISNVASCRGSDLRASNKVSTISSPPLESGLKCYWRLRAPSGQRIQINVASVNFECENACSSFLEVKYKQQKVSTGARFCCEPPSDVIVSENEEVLLIYKGATNIVNGWLGFQLTYKAVPGDDLEVESKTMDPLTEQIEESTTDDTTQTLPSSTTSTSMTKATESTSETSSTSTVTENYEGKWSKWGGWSGCTVSCGGCGRRKRVRACYGASRKCEGKAYEFGECGQQACSYTYKTTRCDGRLILPCDLLEKLDFGTVRLPNSPKVYDQHNHNARSIRSVLFNADTNGADLNGKLVFLKMTPKNAQTLREIHQENLARHKRFVDGDRQLEMKIYCEKRFTYNCPTNLLTISMDWQNAKDTIMRSDTRLCCEGYVSKDDGTCQKS